MNNKYLLIAALMCCVAFQLSSAEKKGQHVVYIGDSITDSNWARMDGKSSAERKAKEWDKNHILGSGYVYFCASYYMGKYPEKEYEFFNRGISGNTLSDLEKRWQSDVIEIKPDVLSVLIGTNDIGRYLGGKTQNPFDFALWEKTYRKLLDQALQSNPNMKFILCSPFAEPIGNTNNEMYPQRIEMINTCASIIAHIAKDYKAVYLPYNKMFDVLIKQHPTSQNTYWIWDGIHPTPAGHNRMATLWIKQVDQAGYLK
ncbi:MAG: SGNH/GDSL hydrolase family protein [Parabacteroides sp.]